MPDIIELLPDSVANQIAAGEVIQRPASVVKELLENSVDAGSKAIHLIIKDGGKTIVQVIDNGIGMTETDARLCFERHATSKIKSANDLFAINTKGFRGEAMASIAAIAHVSLKTRPEQNELGTQIEIEGSTISSQEPVQCSSGTTISVKNLFFNVPARRNFLKSNPVETKHILEEFQRVALAHPEVAFTMTNNDKEVFKLPAGNLRKRIIDLHSKNYDQRLVPVNEDTELIKIEGFVCKPEFARKTRGEQYFMVNRRFIKSPYLHHSILNAFQGLIQEGHHPSYFLNLDVDPQFIDINIHPTKTEIKFEDEKAIYAILHSAIKQSLGKFNVAPSIDFEQDANFVPPLTSKTEVSIPFININPEFNPFETEGTSGGSTATSAPAKQKVRPEEWQDLYQIKLESQANVAVEAEDEQTEPRAITPESWTNEQEDRSPKPTYQLNGRYLITHNVSGFIIIDQHRAHQRVLYEHLLQSMVAGEGESQQLLFPETVTMSPADLELVQELKPELESTGFTFDDIDKNNVVVSGLPTVAKSKDASRLLEDMLEQFKHDSSVLKLGPRESLAKSMAKNLAVKHGERLQQEEQQALIDQLFACEFPYHGPSGKPTIVTFTAEELDKRFE